MEPPEEPPRPAQAPEQPEVVAKHGNRVEPAKTPGDSRDRAHTGVTHSSQAAGFHRKRRVVDGDDVVAEPLQVQGDTASAATHVEDAASNLAYRPPLNHGPFFERREVRGSPCRYIEPAIVPLDDLGGPLTLIVSVDELTVSVVAHLFAASDARGGADGMSVFQMKTCLL